MDDPYVKLGWQVLKAIPQDGSLRSYEATAAIHSLVWTIWQLDSVRGLGAAPVQS